MREVDPMNEILGRELEEINERLERVQRRLCEIDVLLAKVYAPGYEDEENPLFWYDLGIEASSLQSEKDYMLMRICFRNMQERKTKHDEKTPAQEKI